MGKFELYKGRDGMFRFNLRAGNGEIIAVSEPFENARNCALAVELAKQSCLSPVEDQINGKETVEGTKYEMYLDKAGEFRFRLRLSTGNILFHGEGYRSKASCKKGIQSVGRNAEDAPVISLI